MPSVRTFSETSALYSVMEKDLEEARQVCSGMTRAERIEFDQRLKVLQTILAELNAEHCLHCGKRITKVSPSQVRGWYPPEGIWYHPGLASGFCSDGKTATPAPQND